MRRKGEDFTLALGGVEPKEWQVRELLLQDFPPSPDLDHQRAGGQQMFVSFSEDAAHEIEPVNSAGVGNGGLSRVFRWEGRDGVCADVGRIGENEIIALTRMRSEQIRLHEKNAVLQPVVGNVALGHGQRIR